MMRISTTFHRFVCRDEGRKGVFYYDIILDYWNIRRFGKGKDFHSFLFFHDLGNIFGQTWRTA